MELKDDITKDYLVYTDGKRKLNNEVTDPTLEYEIDDFNDGKFPFVPQLFRYLTLAVGYSKNTDTAIVELEKIILAPTTLRGNNKLCSWIEEFHISRIVEVHRKN